MIRNIFLYFILFLGNLFFCNGVWAQGKSDSLGLSFGLSAARVTSQINVRIPPKMGRQNHFDDRNHEGLMFEVQLGYNILKHFSIFSSMSTHKGMYTTSYNYDAVTGTKTHYIIFNYNYFTPTIGLSLDYKYKLFYSEFGLSLQRNFVRDDTSYLEKLSSFLVRIQPLVGVTLDRHIFGLGYFYSHSLKDPGSRQINLENMHGWKATYRFYFLKE